MGREAGGMGGEAGGMGGEAGGGFGGEAGGMGGEETGGEVAEPTTPPETPESISFKVDDEDSQILKEWQIFDSTIQEKYKDKSLRKQFNKK
jgi:hypothetical protein